MRREGTQGQPVCIHPLGQPGWGTGLLEGLLDPTVLEASKP